MRIGVDLGGTKIEALAIAPDGREFGRARVPTPRDDYPGTVMAIRDLVTGIEAKAGARGTVGVGIPGTISPATGLIKNANSIWLIDKPFAQDLSAALEREVRLANDADCFALSEATDGAAAGATSVFGAILGTGCGGGLVYQGRLIGGVNAIAGEWGHNPLPWPREHDYGDERPGPRCYCGQHGCIETFIAGPGFKRDHFAATGEDISTHEIVARAEAGEAAAAASLERYCDRLARGLATVINLFDPYVIVLGGGLSTIGRLYIRVPQLWDRYLFTDRVDTKIVPPKHGDSSGVRGAAWLWPRT